MANQTMNAKDTISAKRAECFLTVDGQRYNFMQAINVEASYDKNKVEIGILGKTSKGHKSTSISYSGSASFYYNTSIMRELLLKFKNTGEDVYFEMQITNEDPTSAAGRQTTILKGCNIDSGIISQFDAESDEVLTEEVEFTFEDFEMPEKFNVLDGML